jgi:hypothetical protein
MRMNTVASAPSALDHSDLIAFLDSIALGYQDFLDHTSARRAYRDFHFHTFQDDDRVIFLDAGSDRRFNLEHFAGDLGFDRRICHLGVSLE